MKTVGRRKSSNVVDKRTNTKAAKKTSRLPEEKMGKRFREGMRRIEAVHRSDTVQNKQIEEMMNRYSRKK